MQLLKQSTATSLVVGPVLDATGLEYASAVIGDISLSKNGTLTALASAATLTYISNGQYTLALTTGNTDTLGRADLFCNKVGYQMPPVRLTVLAAAAFDTLITNGTLASTTSGRTIATDAAGLVDANAVKVGPTGAGTAQTARDLGQGIPNAVPGAAGGLVIAGSNAATTFAGLTTGALSCTTFTASGAVAFQSTFAVATSTALGALSCSTLTSSGAVAFQSTWVVTGGVTFTAGLTSNITGTLSTVTTLTNLPAVTTDWLSAAGVSAAAVTKIQAGLSTYAGADTSGTTTLLSRLTSTRAGLLDNLDAAVSTRSTLSAAGVWDQTVSGHTTTGTFGAAVNAAGSVGDPWSTPLPGAYGAGTAGSILGTNLDATVSSRSTYAGGDTLGTTTLLTRVTAAVVLAGSAPGWYTAPVDVSSNVAAIKLKTDHLPDSDMVNTLGKLWVLDGSGNSVAPAATALSSATWTDPRAAGLDNLDAAVSAVYNVVASGTSGNAALGAALDAVAAKTDNLPADPAGLSALSSAHGAGSWLTATGFAVAGDTMTLDTAEHVSIADTLLRRTTTHAMASSNGDTPSVHSLYGFLCQAQHSSISGTTTLTVKNPDDTTLGTLTITVASGALPVTGVA